VDVQEAAALEHLTKVLGILESDSKLLDEDDERLEIGLAEEDDEEEKEDGP